MKERIEQEKQARTSPYGDYMSRNGNYNIELSVGNGRYYVHIYPRLSETFPGIFGGDAEYVVDAKTFTLVEKRYGK
ncbi:MAG: hypothetical protein ACREXR_16635 [Gammaproteobacteria bacterium]